MNRFKGVVADQVDNQTKIDALFCAKFCFTMINSPQHPCLMQPPFARFIGCVSVYLCDCTMLCVQVMITLSIKQIVRVLLVCLPCKKTATMRMLSFGTPTKAQKKYC
jgi:hypothetical protein